MNRAPRPLLLSTLARMQRLTRGVALLACLGVLGWTLLAATHWHDAADNGSRSHGSECVLCLGTSAGAAPPPHSIVQLAWPPPRTLAVAAIQPRALPSAPQSAYQSRAPPAA